MAGKILLRCMCPALLLAGCATVREKPVPPAPPPPRAAAVSETAPSSSPEKRRPLPASRPAPAQTRASASTRADLPGMIGNGAAWAEPGRTMVVKRGGTGVQQPVPIFRQAGVLATVRGALAGSSAQPRAEFRHGVLTLTFDHGTNDEISAAVKKTLAVAGSSSVRVALQH